MSVRVVDTSGSERIVSVDGVAGEAVRGQGASTRRRLRAAVRGYRASGRRDPRVLERMGP